MDFNRRRYPRANYPCRLTMWPANGSNETILAYTANIGAGGLCVFLNGFTNVGTKVDIELDFPNSTTPFKCKGTVVRCVKEDEKFYDTGIQFDSLDDLKFSFISSQVSDLLNKEKEKN
jgi:hypothetical protein